MDKPYLSLSVHQLVDSLLRVGDIDDRIYNPETMRAGTRIHGDYQGKQGASYLSEYPLSGTIVRPSGTLAISGRADGVIFDKGKVTIDEIKSTVDDLEHFYNEQSAWHKGQALVYAYLFLQSNKKLQSIGIQLTYISQVDDKSMVKSFDYGRLEVEATVESYCDEYLAFYGLLFSHWKKRDASVKDLPFPYPDFRAGQRELAKYCFGVAKNGGVLFAEAPTGIGKTMSTLYPFVKSFKEGRVEKIFYLTAKNTGAASAYKAIGDLKEKGLVVYDSNILARDKICFCPGKRCNPVDCPFAKGYYTELRNLLKKALKSKKRFDQLSISSWCRKAGICPFEFQLDLSYFSDIIICDYNYFFDPISHLERYFDPSVDQSKYLILVDEAHNLVDRGRMMYSAIVSSADLSYAERMLGERRAGHDFKEIRKTIKRVHKAFADATPAEHAVLLEKTPEELGRALDSLTTAENRKWAEEWNAIKKMRLLSEFTREVKRYSTLIKEYPSSSDRFSLIKRGEGELELGLTCIDPCKFLSDSLSRVRGAVLFSATLTPMDYFTGAILGKQDVPSLLLPSPFPESNFKVLIAPKVSVRYKDRDNSYQTVASYLKEFVGAKVGNYFIYFPSYDYLSKIRPYLDLQGANVLVQSKGMKEEEKLDFLASFAPNPSVTTVGLLIIGGAFSEGIDLVSDRLIGVGIVGIGMPMYCFENNLIRDYYEEKEQKGFSYAYQNPGMSKVLQAIGRVIRSESDVGAALLIDDRYLHADYRSILAKRYPSYEVVTNESEIRQSLQRFYSKKGD